MDPPGGLRALRALSDTAHRDYDLQVPLIVTLLEEELASIRTKLRLEQRLTKALPKVRNHDGGLPLVGLLSSSVHSATHDANQSPSHLTLEWMGVAAQYGTVGAVDASVTVDPLRECLPSVVLEGDDGLLRALPPPLREAFIQAVTVGEVGSCSREVWEALDQALRERHPELATLLDWLIAQADPPRLDINDPAERAWLEQQDALRNLARIAEFPPSAFAAWKRPASSGEPYLAGLIPQPVEHSLIDHDIRIAGQPFGMYAEWQGSTETRCDVHILQDSAGRRLEIANVNATNVETHLGTDMIYYHESTKSFVLVQYKRLDHKTKSLTVDDRLRGQLDRLEQVGKLSQEPTVPSEWRMSRDSCFLKLALWPSDTTVQPVDGLVPGMYLPLSYVRLLLAAPCTLGPREGRRLGYKEVERHLVGSQFVELVKHGLAGTVGTSVDDLRTLMNNRLADRHNIMLATERSSETANQRQKRIRTRGSKARPYTHVRQESLFDSAPNGPIAP